MKSNTVLSLPCPNTNVTGFVGAAMAMGWCCAGASASRDCTGACTGHPACPLPPAHAC